MKQSPYRLKKVASLKVKARKLYKQGLTTQVGKLIGRSHARVALTVKEFSTDQFKI